MARYLLLLHENEASHAAQAPPAIAVSLEQGAAYADELRRTGRLTDHGRLRPSREGRRVRLEGARLEVREGPFRDDGRTLGGYYWIEADSLDEAEALAAQCPALVGDEVEVRASMKGAVASDKDAKPGRIFGCVVLGRAQSEAAWVEVMDRIDEETRDAFPATAFLGGIRLEGPRNARRIVETGERRAVVDGPFLESKEVIGGLFFLRMTSLDEAVRWAGGTRFVVHGALEIRELWRS